MKYINSFKFYIIQNYKYNYWYIIGILLVYFYKEA